MRATTKNNGRCSASSLHTPSSLHTRHSSSGKRGGNNGRFQGRRASQAASRGRGRGRGGRNLCIKKKSSAQHTAVSSSPQPTPTSHTVEGAAPTLPSWHLAVRRCDTATWRAGAMKRPGVRRCANTRRGRCNGGRVARGQVRVQGAGVRTERLLKIGMVLTRPHGANRQ